MEQIGFKNFRKFADFPLMDISPISIFVGENNAGKSTVVKGILAISDFMTYGSSADIDLLRYEMQDDHTSEERSKYIKEALRNKKFFFNTSYLAHIGTFKRALYNKAEDNAITFLLNLGLLNISIEVKGNPADEESVSGIVSKVGVDIASFGISLRFDLENDTASVVFKNPQDIISRNTLLPSRFRDSLAELYNEIDRDFTISTLISDNWRPYRSDLVGSLLESIETAINCTLFPTEEVDPEQDMIVAMRGRTPFGKKIKDIDEETIDFLKKYCDAIGNSIVGPRDIRRGFRLPGTRGPMNRMVDIEYLYAHAVTQTVIYSAKDTNDYLSRTIHEFASVQRHKYKKAFIQKWMKEFGIGIDYSIRSVGGEAHIVYITNADNEKVNLADKGMGSIQLMTLLFRIAITLPNVDGRRPAATRRSMGKIVIIEEPEQNIHPMLQSKLADLFFELNQNYGYRFIIETHSEYLIRKTQVLVADNYNTKEKLLENPFKVYYFPSEGTPYEVKYRTNGRFENDFGKGFFDEAANLAFKLF